MHGNELGPGVYKAIYVDGGECVVGVALGPAHRDDDCPIREAGHGAAPEDESEECH